MNTDFEFAILGAGAIGSIIAAHLARAGHQVALLARGTRAEHVARHGLTLSGLADFTVPVTTLHEPQRLAAAAALIVATKTPGTRSALAALRHAHFGVTLSIQNGPLKNELLAEAFGADRVLGALADTSGELLAGGEVLFTRNVGIYVGELAGGDSARADGIAKALAAAGLRGAATGEITTLEWSKFCAWVGMTALAVTTRAFTWQYLADATAALLLVRLVREVGAIARARGIVLSDRAVLPAASLCNLPESAAVDLVRRAGAEYRVTAPHHRMSALQDVLAGRALEVHETLGYADDEARRLRLDLPLLASFRALLTVIDGLRGEPAASP